MRPRLGFVRSVSWAAGLLAGLLGGCCSGDRGPSTGVPGDRLLLPGLRSERPRKPTDPVQGPGQLPLGNLLNRPQNLARMRGGCQLVRERVGQVPSAIAFNPITTPTTRWGAVRPDRPRLFQRRSAARCADHSASRIPRRRSGASSITTPFENRARGVSRPGASPQIAFEPIVPASGSRSWVVDPADPALPRRFPGPGVPICDPSPLQRRPDSRQTGRSLRASTNP